MTKKEPWWRKPRKKDDDEYRRDEFDNYYKDKESEEYEYFGPPDRDLRRARPRRTSNDVFDRFFSRSPFGPRDEFFSDFEREFDDMHKRMEHLFSQAAEGRLQPGEGGPFVYGFSMRTGPDGIPHVQEFGNMPPELRGRMGEGRSLPFSGLGELNDRQVFGPSSCGTGTCGTERVGTGHGSGMHNNTRKPLTDVLDCDNHISITVELPGVEKSDINLEIIDNELELNVESPIRKYFDRIRLPAEVDSESISASYNNGVLEVCVNRLEPKKKKGKKIDIN
jgi:HSP20 family protein